MPLTQQVIVNLDTFVKKALTLIDPKLIIPELLDPVHPVITVRKTQLIRYLVQKVDTQIKLI